MMESKNEQDLASFIAENPLPCFSQVRIEDLSVNITSYDTEVIYLYKEFETSCIFAKCYSNILQTYLLSHRPSYVPPEPELSLTLTKSSNIQYLFSDIISIPLNYNGLFEIFKSNSIKSDGILDHEKDIASLVTRLRKPKNYYVNQDMKVYEIIPDKSNEDLSNLSRKWTRISKGSVCKVIRVVSIDYEDTSHSCLAILRRILCCNTNSIKTDIAIELKLIDTFEELAKAEDKILNSDASKSNETGFLGKESHPKLVKSSLGEKTYFLPVYESTRSNEEIDLIPISSIIRNQRLKTNSLQLAKNFALKSKLKDNYIELKLFEENPFQNNKSEQHQNHSQEQNELVQENQHLELEKYMSIYDLVDYRQNCKVIVGFSFTKRTLIFIPLEPIDIGLKKKCVFSKIDEDKHERAEWFKSNYFEKFSILAEKEIENFNQDLNKIETFAFKKKNFEGLKMAEIEKFFVKTALPSKPSIIHFADLVDMDKDNQSSNQSDKEKFSHKDDSLTSSNSFIMKVRTSNPNGKYNTLPHNQSNDKTNLAEEDLPNRVKRTPRSYSLPIDQAAVIKEFLKTKFKDI